MKEEEVAGRRREEVLWVSGRSRKRWRRCWRKRKRETGGGSGGWKLAPVGNATFGEREEGGGGLTGRKERGGGPLAGGGTTSTENCFSFVFIVWRRRRGARGARKSQLKM